MSDSDTLDKMAELARPIDQQIMMCDTREEILMLASVLLIRVKDMFDSQIGKEGRREILMEAAMKDLLDK
tara:strand:- start:205 stop:414 length:210 start_codon:yes stop_codon:yes gene_type:complete